MTAETFTTEQLATRLDLAERWILTLRIFVVAALVAAAALAIATLFVPRNAVTAQRFAVQNSKGEVIAVLGTEANGMPSLLLSSDGKVRAVLGLRNDGNPYFTLSDADGKVRWAVAVDSSGAHVNASDAGGK